MEWERCWRGKGKDVGVTSGRGEMLAWQWEGERCWRGKGKDVGVARGGGRRREGGVTGGDGGGGRYVGMVRGVMLAWQVEGGQEMVACVTGGVGEMLAWQGERCWRGNGRGRDVGVTSGGGGGEREGGVTGGDGGGGRYGGVTSGVGEMLAWQGERCCRDKWKGRDVGVAMARREMVA